MPSDAPNDPHRPSSLLEVWPTDLRDEWRSRTRYGKVRYLLTLPWYVVGWALILALAVAVIVVLAVLGAIFKITVAASDHCPEVYQADAE